MQLLCEGFDDPGIEALILSRPTKSKALYCQMIGRGVRPNKGKEGCYVYDLSDENHNICSFNVLGFQTYDKAQFESFVPGKKLTDLMRETLKIQINDHRYEEYDLFKNLKELSDILLPHQVDYLLDIGIPSKMVPYLSFSECNYIIWKTEKLKQYGLYQRDYWKKRQDIRSTNKKNCKK